MNITLKLIGSLEKMIKDGKIAFSEDAMTLNQFFTILADRYGKTVGEHLLPEGSFSSHYAVMINGIHITLLKGIETELKDGDTVSVLTLVPGG
jgi:molybdopterin converting factor small subunit